MNDTRAMRSSSRVSVETSRLVDPEGSGARPVLHLDGPDDAVGMVADEQPVVRLTPRVPFLVRVQPVKAQADGEPSPPRT